MFHFLSFFFVIIILKNHLYKSFSSSCYLICVCFLLAPILSCPVHTDTVVSKSYKILQTLLCLGGMSLLFKQKSCWSSSIPALFATTLYSFLLTATFQKLAENTFHCQRVNKWFLQMTKAILLYFKTCRYLS